jgi:opacity protein-like surface antigen
MGDSLILGAAMGFPLFRIFTIYAGGGLGLTFREYSSYSGSGGDIPDSKTEFAWKVNGGLRLQFSSFFTKFDVSYGTILGPAFGIGVGLFM